MSADYTSQKDATYKDTRNNIFLAREQKQQTDTYKASSACRNLEQQSMANYGKKDYK